MPRIALLKQSCKTKGGLEKHTLALLKAFLKQNCEVDLLVQGPFQLDLSPIPGARVKILSAQKYGSWWSLCAFDKALKKHLERTSYDAILGLERHSTQTHYRAGSGVHRFFLDRRLQNASLLKKLSLKLNPFHRKVLALEEATFGINGAKRIYTNSYMVAHQIHQIYQTSWDRLCVIHNGVQWQDYAPLFNQASKLRLEFCEQFNLDLDARYLGFIGHGFERKGLDLALKWLSQSHSDFHLLVVGKDRKLDFFKKLARSLGLEERVHFLGTLENPAKAFTLIERLILPTRYDPFANVTLEALAMGVNVWTSTLNGACEILPNSSADFDLDNHKSWVNAIEQQWRKEPDTLQDKALVRQSVAHLSLELQAEKLVLDLLSTL